MDLYNQRLQRLRKNLSEAGFDGCILLPGANFAYYTGQFKFMDLLTTILYIPAASSHNVDKPVLLVTDFEEYTTASAMTYPAEIIPYKRNSHGYAEGFKKLATYVGLNGKQVGVESTGMRFLETQMLRSAAPGVQLEAIDPMLSGIRAIKTADEIGSIREAVRITEKALNAIFEQMKAGMTEIELRNRFEIEAMKAGAEGMGFSSLVVSGPRAALQHAAPSDRAIGPGDAILFDVGACYQGYTADITRTVVLSPVSKEIREIHAVVLEANNAAESVTHPGVSVHEVDQAARNVIQQAGYGETFTHGTGHGLGLDVHEPPRVAPEGDMILEAGMVFTIEPGIYLTDRFGVRIEDDVTVTKRGCDRLTSLSKDLVVI